MKILHSWLKEYVGEAMPSAKEVERLLTFHSFEIDGVEEVEGEAVIDVDVLPNRSSDCLCHRGVARELATVLGTPLKVDPLREPVELEATDSISVTIADTDACPRFTAALIEGVEVKDSPEWLQTRLKALGQRPINNIVDATNYVMYAIGQPLHAYDADLFPQVDEKWQFGVRFAAEGEEVSILPEGGKEEDRVVTCQGTELLIVDESSNTPIGLAGVKGGRFAGVHSGTKRIIIEAANFHPTITRKTARRLGIVIDASKRFENEPSRELPPYAQRDIVKLITDIAGGEFAGYLDEYPQPIKTPSVTVTTTKTNALLGLTLTDKEITKLLENLGAEVAVTTPGNLSVTGPWERTDLTIEEDFIEEVGRLYGLHNIEAVPPTPTAVSVVNLRQYYSERIRHALLNLGFSEVITSSFHKKGKIQLQNALASDKSYVRGNLSKNVHQVLDQNYTHTDLLGVADIRVFEIGTVFTKTDEGVSEHLSLALSVRQKGTGYTPKDDDILEAAKAVVAEALGYDEADWQQEKGVAETNLTAVLSSVAVPEAYEPIEYRPNLQFRPISPYPAVSRDIAMWVSSETDTMSAEQLINDAAGPLRVRTTHVDTFEKDGRTSLAFRLVFQSQQKTLTDSEVNAIMDDIYAAVAKAGFEVR